LRLPEEELKLRCHFTGTARLRPSMPGSVAVSCLAHEVDRDFQLVLVEFGAAEIVEGRTALERSVLEPTFAPSRLNLRTR
jgi:hypothetical protein